jgi:nucleotide-binding universal stress UspA family protein
MIKTILASLTGCSSDRTVLQAAVAVARIDGGHIDCLRTRIDAVEAAALMAATSPRQNADVHGLLRKISDEEAERSSHARQAFEDICKRYTLSVRDTPTDTASISAAWKEQHSFLNETLHEARYHDLTIMGRDEELSSDRITGVLMQSGRPLLLAPEKPADVIGQNVVVAWKATPEAARALTAASRVLAGAGRVTILSVSKSEAGDDTDRLSAEELASQLAWAGIKPDVRMCYSPTVSTSQALLDMAYECDADLLVMGAYGHSRVKEFIFGGVTRDLLAASPLPVFMAS